MPPTWTPSLDEAEHIRVADGKRCPLCGLTHDDCMGTTPEAVDAARRFITEYDARIGWTFAKSMPGIPHEYAVRQRAAAIGLEQNFGWFIRMTKDYGYKRKFGSRAYLYLNIETGGVMRRYWTMTGRSAHEYERIINRCPVHPADQDALRAEKAR